MTTLRRDVLEKYSNQVFVETGTYIGTGVQQALDCGFQRVITIEIDPEKVELVKQKFANEIAAGRVTIVQGDTFDVFDSIVQSLDEPATFWLDAHWDGGPVGKFKCPLPYELECIANHPIKTHKILIDDRRLFGLGSWGEGISQDHILNLVKQINSEYEIAFEDGYIPLDVIGAKIL